MRPPFSFAFPCRISSLLPHLGLRPSGRHELMYRCVNNTKVILRNPDVLDPGRNKNDGNSGW